MIPDFLIDQIRRREQEKKKLQEQLVLELPTQHPDAPTIPKEEASDRSVVVIDLNI